jgi:hypothetical protein
MKRTSLDAIAFEPGRGTTALESASNPLLNNPSTTKQSLDAGMTELPVLAGDSVTQRYWYGLLPLAVVAPPRAPEPAPPAAQAPAPAPAPAQEASAPSSPAPPPGTSTVPPPVRPATLRAATLRVTLAGRVRRTRVTFELRTSAPLRTVRAVLVRRGRTVARATLARLAGRGRLVLRPSRRLRRGRHTLTVRAVDERGAPVVVTRRITVR